MTTLTLEILCPCCQQSQQVSKADLTAKQLEVATWIDRFIQTNKTPPTIREIMKGLNYKSPAPVQFMLHTLREKGVITWQDGKSRTIAFVGQQSHE